MPRAKKLSDTENMALVWGSGAAGGLLQAIGTVLEKPDKKGRKPAQLLITKLIAEYL